MRSAPSLILMAALLTGAVHAHEPGVLLALGPLTGDPGGAAPEQATPPATRTRERDDAGRDERSTRATPRASKGKEDRDGVPRMFATGRRMAVEGVAVSAGDQLPARARSSEAGARPHDDGGVWLPPEPLTDVTVRHRGATDGSEAVDVLFAGPTVRPFLQGQRASANDLGRAGGRRIEATAGLLLAAEADWSLRLAVSQEFVNVFGEGEAQPEVSVGVQRRF
jgi:hypothetical protein